MYAQHRAYHGAELLKLLKGWVWTPSQHQEMPAYKKGSFAWYWYYMGTFFIDFDDFRRNVLGMCRENTNIFPFCCYCSFHIMKSVKAAQTLKAFCASFIFITRWRRSKTYQLLQRWTSHLTFCHYTHGKIFIFKRYKCLDSWFK